MRGRMHAVGKYMNSFKNVLDLLLLGCTLAAAGLWVRLIFDESRSFDLETTDFIDLESVAKLAMDYRLLSCGTLLLHAVGLLPYLEMSDQLSLVTRTIRYSVSNDLPCTPAALRPRDAGC